MTPKNRSPETPCDHAQQAMLTPIEDEPIEMCIRSGLRQISGVHSPSFGIKFGRANIKAIIEVMPPKNIQELKGSLGRFTFICRFISNLSGDANPSLD